MARPQIYIDWEEFDKLCGFQFTLAEISEWFSVSEDTIQRAVKREKAMPFAEYYKIKSARGRGSLRRRMYEQAMGGDRVLLIWLSKQYLGMADNQKTEVTGKDGGPQVILYLPTNGSEAPSK
jgi:hypothetical protein